MADKKPLDFTAASTGQITADTQWYTQVLGGAAPNGDYRLTLNQLITFLRTQGFARILSGSYNSDADAITGGGAVGEYYNLLPTNIYGIPTGNGGLLKRIEA
jgi:hypothetical protein